MINISTSPCSLRSSSPRGSPLVVNASTPVNAITPEDMYAFDLLDSFRERLVENNMLRLPRLPSAATAAIAAFKSAVIYTGLVASDLLAAEEEQIDEEEAEDNLVLVAVSPTADDAFSKAPQEVQSTIVQSWLAQHREEYNKIITKCSKIIP